MKKSIQVAIIGVIAAVCMSACGSSQNDFIINGTILESYQGEGGDIIIPGDVKTINADVFQNNDSITSIKFPYTTYSVEPSSFQNCSNLKSVTFGDRIHTICDHAFYNCESLTTITLGSNMEEIGDFAFDGCNELRDVYYDGTEQKWNKIDIGVNAFSSSFTVHFSDDTSKIINALSVDNIFMAATVQYAKTQIGTDSGTRAFIKISKETAKSASQEDFAEFLKKQVDGRNYNWFTIDFGDGTGIVFPGCQWEIGTYCKLQPEGMQGETIGYLKVVDRDNYIVEYQAK